MFFFVLQRGLGKRIAFVLDDDLLSVPKDVPSHPLYGNRFLRGNFENDLLSDVIISLKRKYCDKVEFYFIGNHPSCADSANAVAVPRLPYDKYLEFIKESKIDIGLAPMPDTEFHSCKHYNKFMEYTRAGICGLYCKCATIY